MALQPLPRKARLRIQATLRKTGGRLAKPIEPSKATEVKYRRDLNKLISQMAIDVNQTIVPLLVRYESDYVADVTFTGLIGAAIGRLVAKYQEILKKPSK